MEAGDGNEQGKLVIVLNGLVPYVPNVIFATFSLDIGAAGSPYTVMATVPGPDLATALAEIQGDGVFFFRVNMRRNTDFYVFNPQVTIDGDLVILGPPSLALFGSGLARLVFGGRRRKGRP